MYTAVDVSKCYALGCSNCRRYFCRFLKKQDFQEYGEYKCGIETNPESLRGARCITHIPDRCLGEERQKPPLEKKS